MGRQPDNDKKQQIRDNFLARNRYALDLRFVLRDGKKHPAAILIPGGAYRAVCSFIEGVPIARKLNEKGISAIILYYRVRRKASYPAPMDDLARAVRECLEKADELGLDMDSYSVAEALGADSGVPSHFHDARPYTRGNARQSSGKERDPGNGGVFEHRKACDEKLSSDLRMVR